MTREEAVARIKDHIEIHRYHEWSAVKIFEALDMAIKALAQPEIVMCKDCKYWREHKYAKETKRYIPFCGFNAIYTKADDFCSMAERRSDDEQ